MMFQAIAVLLMSVLPMPKEIHTEAVEYRHGDVVLQGYLAYDAAQSGKRPGVILVHEWKGHGDYVKRRAEQVAQLGYVAFAVDMYGKGVFAKDHIEAGRLAGAFLSDRKLMRERAAAGLEVLAKNDRVDPKRIAAMGYCFGGATVLEMARAGFDLRGVASFHGSLATPQPADAKTLKAKVIVFHGALDQHVDSKQVMGLMDEMKNAGADWQFVAFGGAMHSFTVKEANDPEHGMAYNEAADRRSWEMLKNFLGEVLR